MADFSGLDQFGALELGIDAEVSLDVFTQLDRCETGLHGRWPIT
jgi:hypothetical protein